MDTLVHFGGAVKALGDGKVAGYLVTFGDETTPDLSWERDFFTKATDYDIDAGDKRSAYYAHGLDVKMGVKKIGTLTVTDMAKDDVGVWVEAQMALRDDYERAVYKMAQDGKLGWSSGAPSHLVTRKAIKTESGTVHEVLTWPIAEGSLTPTPAEPRCGAVALKSLPSLIGIPSGAEDHTTKALPSGMSYDDLRALLQDELNEDIGNDDDFYGPGLWIVDIYDDALVYRDEEDLIRIPYTVTAGNDVTWGTPETVIRTTVYQPATDGDDAADAGDAAPMMKSQADVAALKAMLRASMTLDDHAAIVQDAMAGYATRAEGLADTATKAGRAMSASRHAKLKAAHTAMSAHMQAMAGHLDAINAMLTSTDPDAKKEIEDFAALRGRFVRLQSDLLHL